MRSMLAAFAAILALASAGSARAGFDFLPTPPSGYESTFFVAASPNRVQYVQGRFDYTWYWNVPMPTHPGYFETYSDDGTLFARCNGPSCSNSTSTHGRSLSVAMSPFEDGVMVRIANRSGIQNFDVCSTSDDSVFPCGLTIRPVWFEIGGDFFSGADVTLIGTSAVPEPATWAMLIGGFGVTGAMLRRRRQALPAG